MINKHTTGNLKTFSLDDNGIIFSVNDAAEMASSWFMSALLDNDKEFMKVFYDGLLLGYDGIPDKVIQSLINSVNDHGGVIHKLNLEFEARNKLEYPT